MMHSAPTATYRIQLREGVDFDNLARHLDYIAGLGMSHLYLSPIFTASSGSTHGYDVINPNQIDPALGGRAAFEQLVAAARRAGLGIVLDIVPNHTAFTLENPWLQEVLRDGRNSAYASHFDIDWNAGPLVLPILPEPFEHMLAAGRFSVNGGHFTFDGTQVPLADAACEDVTDIDALRKLHEQQHWRLKHWEAERDSITHRRFFNVTSLIGMRVEDPEVFDDTHALTLDLVRAGLVNGLRVDHIDGLADPAAYLERLSQALPGTPIWVEKILVGDESLPKNWKTVGTTGYESARLLARALTHRNGMEQLDQVWRDLVQEPNTFSQALTQAKKDILEFELAAELHQLVALAADALQNSPLAEPGPETLREAVMALLAAVPRYRTYIDSDGINETDRAIVGRMSEMAAKGLRSEIGVKAVASLLLSLDTAPARTFALRFQQVSGALLAKAQEDTAGFRWSRYLAANEVGAEPAEPTVDRREADRFLSGRTPWDMNLTSTHDTKRSEDSRMRMVAISHQPEAFRALYLRACELPEAADVAPAWRWYIVQTCLAVWDLGDAHLEERLGDHTRKAMREAKQASFWTRPNDDAENKAIAFAHAVLVLWREAGPAELEKLVASADTLILAQLALKSLLPGFPDFYRGSETVFLALTDPDNRRPVDWGSLAVGAASSPVATAKMSLTRELLGLRHTERQFLERAASNIVLNPKGVLLSRSDGQRALVAGYAASLPAGIEPVWHMQINGQVIFVGWDPALSTA
ncbi:(1-_4)-alpha-D-glucan 1-alpha-D-glucosylmutase [Devosia subaequoris]|uniref:(1->4)-alpha-D-glucan 1-alpha-D-glucosylmutase n=1 Tax=Devosia subaequoris TaxID=395930 RepID=A0A7W6IM58_9HYPH|nr:malto-oligosyltrehalose synthase [Devosia subaequoris]MBB4052159.1 (1->4)-alpha-D-glucan 1-alpha-D-glucosylmutase [Devosia subaequoris]MCP1209323.1 malto-oligosyltrehalose synthase [Devosia subaequoris]